MLSVRSRIRNINVVDLRHPPSGLFVTLCGSEFLPCAIFLLSKKTSFNVFREAGPLATDFLSLCGSEKVFLSLSLLKNDSAGRRIAGRWVFSPNTSRTSFRSLLARIVSEHSQVTFFPFFLYR